MPNHEQKHVQAQVESEVQSQQEGRRKAWRGMLIPAVGSASKVSLLPLVRIDKAIR